MAPTNEEANKKANPGLESRKEAITRIGMATKTTSFNRVNQRGICFTVEVFPFNC